MNERNSGRKYSLVAMVLVFLLGALVGFGVSMGVSQLINRSAESVPSEPELEPEPEPQKEPEIKAVDFQPVIDTWVNTVGGNKSIMIYDLDLDKPAGSYNVSEDYNTASLYKLFVVYEGYKRVESGAWDGNARAGSTGKTILQCLDLAVRESHSPCAETLWSMIGHAELDAIVKNEWGITNSDISHLTSNVGDITKILKRFYEHPDFNGPELLDAMWDSFLNQPDTTYEWRQGLPRGFSKASVYNKVGWAYNAAGKYWNIYHDAAIVKFPTEDGKMRNFIVVVMTNKIDYPDIRRFGTELENYFYGGE